MGADDHHMVPSSERTLLITIRIRIERSAQRVPVITVRRHELDAPERSERTAVSHSSEEVLGVVRDWMSEFTAME